MSASLATVSYLGATILFILCLGGLSNQETARRGNLYGIIGMTIAVLATVFGPRVVAGGLPWIVGAMVGSATTFWTGQVAGRSPELVIAQVGSNAVNSLLQANEDGKLQKALFREAAARHARRVEDGLTPQPGDATPVDPDRATQSFLLTIALQGSGGIYFAPVAETTALTVFSTWNAPRHFSRGKGQRLRACT